jgi:type IV secretion system protein VirB2
MSFLKKLKLHSFVAVFIFLLSGLAPNIAFASTNATSTSGSIDGVMCNAYKIFKGPLGKTFAVFAIVALGVGFFLGKVSWGTAIAIALGIGAIFGAPALVTIITGGGSICVDGVANA